MKKTLIIVSLIFLTNSIIFSQECTSCYGTSFSGSNPSAIGINTEAHGNAAFAAGFGSQATAFYSTALGFYSFATYTKAISLGSMVKANMDRSVTIGSGGSYGSGKYLENNIERSLMIGFGSQYPTLFVSESDESVYYDKTGRIGIGNVTNPQAKLHLLADEGEAAAIFIQPHSWENNESATLLLGSLGSRITATKNKGMDFYSENNYIFNNGFVGINTYNPPEYNLHVNGGTFTKAFRLYDDTRPPEEGYVLLSDDLGNAYWRDPTEFSLWRLNENGKDIYRTDGNVGIGTSNTDGYRLAVNGHIVAELIKIIENVPASDYVFKEDYKLMPLYDLEKFVNKNHHLPEVKSAKEFKEEGYNLGDMDDVLLRKVEELTLYTIEQQKLLDKQQQVVDLLMKQVLVLEQKINHNNN